MAAYMGNVLLNSVVCSLLFIVIMWITPLFKEYTKIWKYVVLLALAIKLIIPLELFSLPGGMSIEYKKEPSSIENEVLHQTNSDIDVVHQNSQMQDEYSSKETINEATNSEINSEINSEGSQITDSQLSVNKLAVKIEIIKQFLRLNMTHILSGMFLIWSTVAMAGILLYIIIYQYHRYIIRRWSTPIKDEKTLRLFEEEKQIAGVKKSIVIERCRKINSPMTVGLVHKKVLVPAIDSDYEELRYVLRHELIHIKRGDMYVKLIFVVTKCLHWFNPLVHKLANEAYDNLELMCDDEVVESLNKKERVKYNEALIEVARKQILYNDTSNFVFSFGFVQEKDGLKERIINIMDMKKRKKGYALTWMLCVIVICLGSTMKIVESNVEEVMVEVGLIEVETETTVEMPTEAQTAENVKIEMDMDDIRSELDKYTSDLNKYQKEEAKKDKIPESESREEIEALAERIANDELLWKNIYFTSAYINSIAKDKAGIDGMIYNTKWLEMTYIISSLDGSKMDNGDIEVVEIDNEKYVKVNEKFVENIYELLRHTPVVEELKEYGHYSRKEKSYYLKYKEMDKINVKSVEYDILEKNVGTEKYVSYDYYIVLTIELENAYFSFRIDNDEYSEYGFSGYCNGYKEIGGELR